MGMLNDFRMGLGNQNKANATGATTVLDTMGAIEAHIRWKVRLEVYLSGTGSEKIDPAVVEKDDQCALGQWIHGAGGARYHGNPMIAELTETHAAFHKCVAEIVRTADRGEVNEATDRLQNGEYSRISYRIKTQLARLSLSLNKAS